MAQTVSGAAKTMTPISDSKAIGPETSFGVAGFTLLELLLVLSILAMASILVVPNLGSLDSRSFRAQVHQATSLLNYSRRIAVVSGQPSTASFFVTEDSPSSGASRSSVGRWDSHGTLVRYRDSTDRELEVEEKIEITFYPEGGSTGGTLVFTQDDLSVNIIVNPFTGRVVTQYLDED